MTNTLLVVAVVLASINAVLLLIVVAALRVVARALERSDARAVPGSVELTYEPAIAPGEDAAVSEVEIARRAQEFMRERAHARIMRQA